MKADTRTPILWIRSPRTWITAARTFMFFCLLRSVLRSKWPWWLWWWRPTPLQAPCNTRPILVQNKNITSITLVQYDFQLKIRNPSSPFMDLHMNPMTYNFSFIHSIGMCRMRLFLAVLRSFFHSSLLRTFSCHPSPSTILPSSLTSSCHLFLGLPLKFVVPKFIYNTLLGILFSSILCTCPNQHTLINLTVYIIVGILKLA